MEDHRKEERRSAMRSMIVFLLIIITVRTILGFYIPETILSPVSFMLIAAVTVYFVGKVLRNRNPDKYEQLGQSAVNMQQLAAFLGLSLSFYFVYVIIQSVWDIFSEPNSMVSFISTIAIFLVVVKVVDTYAGRDVEMYLDHKRKSHKKFVDSLGPVEGKCMSCQKKIDANDQVCPFCGFKQREIKQDPSYIKQ